MVAVWFARILGLVLLALSIVGFFVDGHLFGVVTVDLALDISRLVHGVLLCIAGFAGVSRMVRNLILGIVATTYLLSALTWFMDREVYGMAPSRLTVFDLVSWIVLGCASLAMMLVPDRVARRRDEVGEALLSEQRRAERG
ncbi:hypothetical protein ACIGCK_06190 [Microbacterium sp. NPDC078428]|uniref:hypothetical protein n=1 Tax=Microbacterium sp. NPDC078428 TaxID=3364190 RepID=UPI0037CBAF95